MSTGRTNPVVVKLLDGRVLVAGGLVDGGSTVSSAEIYDPATGLFSSTGSMLSPRQGNDITLDAAVLADGRALIAGGFNDQALATAEVYDPLSGTFMAVGSMTSPRYRHSVVKLANGQVLVMGGINLSNAVLNTAEIFDPATNIFTKIANISSARHGMRAIRLSDNRIMISGGRDQSNNLVNIVEFYTPQ